MKRNFKGIWIPSELWLYKDLSIIEKIFLVEIDSLDNVNGCYASNKYFAEFFNLSKGRCSQIISSLESKKLISIHLEKEGKQVVKRLIRVVNKLNNPFNFYTYPYLENDKENNTITIKPINNIYNFKKSLVDYGFKEDLVSDWLKVRKKKKASNTKTAFNGFVKQVELTNKDINLVLEECVNRSWAGFKAEWLSDKNQKKEKKSAAKIIQEKYGIK